MMSDHDDVIKWKHFPRYSPFVRGIHRSPVNSPHKSQWRGVLMFSYIRSLNKRSSKQSWGWWFEAPSRSLWCHCNVLIVTDGCLLESTLVIFVYQSTVNGTYELSVVTHVIALRSFGKHSTGPSTYGPWVRIYCKLFSCKSIHTICSYRVQSHRIYTYGSCCLINLYLISFEILWDIIRVALIYIRGLKTQIKATTLALKVMDIPLDKI